MSIKTRKILGILSIIIGGAMLLFSDYIAEQVAEGRLQIRQGQQSVDTVDSLFSQSKYTKPFGQAFTGSAQRKIDAGKAEADKYETLSGQLKIGGIILIVVGIGLFFIGGRKK
ncbi:MAG: hypothetical protein COT85_01350 [Chlamydiae bacterium CG10_big_fil_rev_8_21_14_0_10_42_34]|nr:MAG: hypothetical protein COT85_01350 [Chlamydiae bacterium CG10_big_fil_rev_8_21_14_0_10_42_34]